MGLALNPTSEAWENQYPMSKRNRRTSKAQLKPRQTQVVGNRPRTLVPSAQTLMRFMLRDLTTGETVAERARNTSPAVWRRDQRRVERIESTLRVEELLELVTSASGLAHHAWLKRMRAFGPGAAPAIAERLKNLPLPPLHKDRSVLEEKFIEALRWCGDAGMAALLDVWASVSDYGRSVICVVVGLLQARQAADRVWAFYEKVKDNQRENLCVGPLWALIDLQDERAAGALLELLTRRRLFYELFGFVSRAGDRRTVIPLCILSTDAPEATREEAMWALTSIAHRIGRAAFREELDGVLTREDQDGQHSLEVFADRIYSRSAEEAADYFSLFYQRGVADSPGELQDLETRH